MGIYTSVTELIGGTPLLRLGALERRLGLDTALLAKLEARNPAGSAKDRVALAIVEDAEAKGALRPGATIIEPTSGNTGIGLAAVAAARGYKAVFTMPESMSLERRKLHGGLRRPGSPHPRSGGHGRGHRGGGAPPRRDPRQFPGRAVHQPRKPRGPLPDHRAGALGGHGWETGRSGGRRGYRGAPSPERGRYLKEQNPAITLVAVEPAGSPVLSGGAPGPHGLMGIGAGFVPETLDGPSWTGS